MIGSEVKNRFKISEDSSCSSNTSSKNSLSN